MIDDHQLLCLSRNLVAAMFVALGVYAVLEGMTSLMWWFQIMGPSSASNWNQWSYSASGGTHLGMGALLIFKRNWIARKLIKPAPADTCPQCDYPIAPAATECPECGLALAPSDNTATQPLTPAT